MKKSLAILTAIFVALGVVTPTAANEPPGKYNPWYWTGDIPSDKNRYTVFDSMNNALIGSQIIDEEIGRACIDNGPGCNFDAMPAISGNYVLATCKRADDYACVHEITVTNSNGDEVYGKLSYFYESPFPKHPMMNQPGSDIYGIPDGNMVSIWQIPGVIHSGGNDLYVMKFVLNWRGCRNAVAGCVPGSMVYSNMSFTLVPFSLFKFSGFQSGGVLPANNQHNQMAGVWESFPENVTVNVSVNLPDSIGKWVKVRASDVSVETEQVGDATTRLKLSGKPVLVSGVSVERSPIRDPYGNFNSPGNSIGVGNDHMWYLEPIREVANDRADGELRIFGFETVDAGYATGFNYTSCLKDSNAFGGFVASNSMFYSSGAPRLEGGFLTYDVGGLHYRSDGQLAKGNYEMHIRKSVASCINGQKEVSPYASISVLNEQGQEELATTVVNTTGDWVSLRASNFTFSQKTMRVDLNKQAGTQIKSPVVTIRALGNTKARISISNPVGAGKIEVFLNGKRQSTFTIRSSKDRNLTRGSLVRTINLKTKQTNVVMVRVNGKVIQQSSFKR